ncbi:Uncharacterised protein [Klebsiella pneumoniae]|nr:Uncharacterised protein [Klebsiella pneumoniae]
MADSESAAMASTGPDQAETNSPSAAASIQMTEIRTRRAGILSARRGM